MQEGFKIPFIESLDGCGIFDIGLGLLHGTVDGLRIVELLGKAYDFGTHKYIGTGDFPLQANAIERGTPAQCHVGLTSCKYASGKVDNNPAEGQSLAFVYRNRPSQPDRVLRESA